MVDYARYVVFEIWLSDCYIGLVSSRGTSRARISNRIESNRTTPLFDRIEL